MLRRIFLALALVSSLLALTVRATFAVDPDNAGNGNCSTEGHWIAGNQAPQTPTTLYGVQATIDAPSNAYLCTNSGEADNGWFSTVAVRYNIAGDNNVGSLGVGIARCDSFVVVGCDSTRPDVQPRYIVHNVSCVEPFNSDIKYDLGPADWAPHQYRLWYDGVRYWYAYRDGSVLFDGPTQMKFDTNTVQYSCLKPNGNGGYGVIGGYQSERWDLGDGWGDGGLNYMKFIDPSYRNQSSWIGDSGSGACDGNNWGPGSPYHVQYCNWTTNPWIFTTNTIY